MKYLVLKQHFGDRQYWSREVRYIEDDELANRLITAGLIAPIEKTEKAKRPPRNKAEQDHENKADA